MKQLSLTAQRNWVERGLTAAIRSLFAAQDWLADERVHPQADAGSVERAERDVAFAERRVAFWTRETEKFQ